MGLVEGFSAGSAADHVPDYPASIRLQPSAVSTDVAYCYRHAEVRHDLSEALGRDILNRRRRRPHVSTFQS